MTTPTTPIAASPTPSGRKWPFIIVGLLLTNVAVCAVTVTLALRNPAAVEPDYYQRGLDWDESHAPTAQQPAVATTPTTTD